MGRGVRENRPEDCQTEGGQTDQKVVRQRAVRQNAVRQQVVRQIRRWSDRGLSDRPEGRQTGQKAGRHTRGRVVRRVKRCSQTREQALRPAI